MIEVLADVVEMLWPGYPDAAAAGSLHSRTSSSECQVHGQLFERGLGGKSQAVCNPKPSKMNARTRSSSFTRCRLGRGWRRKRCTMGKGNVRNFQKRSGRDIAHCEDCTVGCPDAALAIISHGCPHPDHRPFYCIGLTPIP